MLDGIATRQLGRGPVVISSIGGGAVTGSLVFLHQRQAPGGQPKLLSVFFYGSSYSGGWEFCSLADQLDMASPFSTSIAAMHMRPGDWALNHGIGSLRLYAGQSDPADPVHFTIAYRIGQQSGSIDCRLTLSGSVTYRIQSGPAMP